MSERRGSRRWPSTAELGPPSDNERFEGGWGYDTSTGAESSPHSTENMCMLLGGKAGGLHADNVGRHIDGAGRHPTAVLNTALQAVDVPETLGEVPGIIEELL